jgi:sugar lactone lactonase YvrE
LASGQSLVLQNNATNSTSVIANGAFTFSNAMASGAAYSVTVTTQPIGQTCTVANANGTMSASVSNVVVSCDSSTVTLFVSTFAGTGQKGYADGPGTTATFDFAPFNESLGLAIDSKNYLYLADTWNHKIRKISMATGVVSTVAGSGLDAELDGTATTAAFSHASGIAIDAMDNIYVTDYSSIRKISAVNGAVTTLAGGGSCTDLICGVDGIGNKASFRMARGIAIDKLGNLYVADTGNHKIRKVSSTGVVSTFAGSGLHGSSDGVGAAASFYSPTGVTIGSDGSLFVSDSGTRLIRKISPSGVVTTLAGAPGEYTCASGTSQSPVFGGPSGIAVNTAGTIYVADEACGKVFSISPSGAVSIYAGGGVSDSDGPALTAGFSGPGGIILDQKNNIYVINSYIPKIKVISKK